MTNLASLRAKKASASRSAAVKARLDFPVIDTDVHTVEFGPLLEDYIHKYGGSKVVDEFRARRAQGLDHAANPWYQLTPEQRHDHRDHRPAFWILPSRNTYDLATVSLPRLLAERLEEQGTDFAVLYPNISLFLLHSGHDELRRPLVRAVNHYRADLYRPYRDRLSPVAAVPLHTPEEGIEELEFAVKELGLNTVVIPGAVRRQVKAIADKYPPKFHPDIAGHAYWLDFYGLDSEYDYDPFWAKAVELGVAPATHSGSQGWTGRASISNYMYNHIGHSADASEALAKALFFGGVTRRFPQLRIGLLEGGAAWGSQVYTHLVDRFRKRNRHTVLNYSPALLDTDLLYRLYKEYGADVTGGKEYSKDEIVSLAFGVGNSPRSLRQNPAAIDDFALAGIERVEDIRDRFVPNFFFGNEADDRTVAAAFNTRVNPFGAKLNAFWSSGTGHWNVPELTETLAETWGLVEEGVLTEEDFRDLVFTNSYRFYTEANPNFFRGTVIEEKLNGQQVQRKAA